jgi:hypothetical protein
MSALTTSDPQKFKQKIPAALSGPDTGRYQHPTAPPVFQPLYERLLLILMAKPPRYANTDSW